MTHDNNIILLLLAHPIPIQDCKIAIILLWSLIINKDNIKKVKPRTYKQARYSKMILQRSKLLTLKLLPLIAALLQVVLLPPKSFVVQAQAGDFPAFIDSTELKTAIALWVDNRTLAVRQFGNISDWDVSKIEDFSRAFQNLNLVTAFDEDLSSWNTSSALDMTAMCVFFVWFVIMASREHGINLTISFYFCSIQ